MKDKPELSKYGKAFMNDSLNEEFRRRSTQRPWFARLNWGMIALTAFSILAWVGIVCLAVWVAHLIVG
jgi:hypothetical protein